MSEAVVLLPLRIALLSNTPKCLVGTIPVLLPLRIALLSNATG